MLAHPSSASISGRASPEDGGANLRRHDRRVAHDGKSPQPDDGAERMFGDHAESSDTAKLPVSS